MKNLSLSVKIGTGFAVVILLTIIVGLSGYFPLDNVVGVNDLFRSLDQVKSHFTLAARQGDRYFLFNHDQGREEQERAAALLKQYLTACTKDIVEIEDRYRLSKDIQSLLKGVISDINAFNSSFNQLSVSEKNKIKTATDLLTLFNAIVGKSQFLEDVKSAAGILKADCQGYFDRNTPLKWNSVVTHHQAFADTMAEWKERAGTNAYMKKSYETMEMEFVKISPLLDHYKAEVDRQADFISTMEQSKIAVTQNLTQIREVSKNAMNLDEASNKLKSIAENLAVTAKDTSDKTNTVAVSSEELSMSMTPVAAAMDQAALNVNTVSQSTSKMTATIATAVQGQSAITSEISDSVSQVATGIHEVNENISQSTLAVADIAKQISIVNSSADDVSENSNEINDSANALTGFAAQQNTLVGKFKF